MIMKDPKPETFGIRDELLKTETILILLIVADILVPINRFSMFLQKKTLIYVDTSHKLKQLK